MTQNCNEAVKLSLMNRKKAYRAMCKATILLFVFSILSTAVTEGLIFVINKYSFVLQKILHRIICLFGVESGSALIATRNLTTSGAFYEVIQMFATVFTMVIPVLIFAKAAKIKSNEYFNVKGRCIKGLLPMIGMCQMITTFVLLFSSFVTAIFISPVFNTNTIPGTSAVATEFNPFEFGIMVISYAVLVPIIEEFIFRGVIFSYLKKYGTVYAVIASSLLFGIAHSSPEQSVFAFSFGIIAAFTVVVTGNMKTSMILHAVNNFFYVINSYTVGTRADSISRAFEILVFGAGIVGIYYTVRKDGYMDMFHKNKSCIDNEAVVLPGMREVITVPIVLYILLYAARFVLGMIM